MNYIPVITKGYEVMKYERGRGVVCEQGEVVWFAQVGTRTIKFIIGLK